MNDETKVLSRKVQALSPSDRIALVEDVLESLDSVDPAIEMLWGSGGSSDGLSPRRAIGQGSERYRGQVSIVRVRFLDIAEAELDDAIAWYEGQALGLGKAFLLEAMTAANRIARHPEAWHRLDEGVRRCRLTRFPYGLIYAVEHDDILILAVAHLHRKPDYWRERLQQQNKWTVGDRLDSARFRRIEKKDCETANHQQAAAN